MSSGWTTGSQATHELTEVVGGRALITFQLLFRSGALRLARLRDDLVMYRLALGQPEPPRLEAIIKHFRLDQSAVRSLALNLWPAVPLR